MKKIFLITTLLFISLSAFAKLDGEMKAYKITTTEGVESKKIATEVVGGDVIEYHIIYKNSSTDSIKNVSIKGIIHESTDLLKGTETMSTKPLYSVDAGSTWSEEPTILNTENGQALKAPVSEYNAIKWVVDSFDGNEEKTFIYRVKVKEA